MKTYCAKYKELDAIIMENEVFKISFLPSVGGKMASLTGKLTGKEYLWQEDKETISLPDYNSPFVESDMFGFDDMFPTIDKCYYPCSPWKGISIPDHGEVWSLPWKYNIERDYIHMWVNGVRLPYRLDKWYSFSRTNVINIKYRLKNYTNFKIKFIWAAHPLFNMDENTKIILPEDVKKVFNVYGESKRLGSYGKTYDWPVNSFNDYNFSQIYLNSGMHCEKYYILDELNEGWAALYNEKTKEVIGLSFPVKKVPYLGVWINEGGYYGQYNMSLEPCTGAFDRIDYALQWNKCSEVGPGGTYEWFLNLTVDHSNSIPFSGINEKGELKY